MHCRSFGRQVGAALAVEHEQGGQGWDNKMDYWNNEKGLAIYDANPNSSFADYNTQTYNAVKAGLMKYMKEGWSSDHLTDTDK